MTEARDVQIVVRPRDGQLLEKHLRHVGVEMLARVDDDLTDGRAALIGLPDGTRHGRGFDELRAGADDGEELHCGFWFLVFGF